MSIQLSDGIFNREHRKTYPIFRAKFYIWRRNAVLPAELYFMNLENIMEGRTVFDFHAMLKARTADAHVRLESLSQSKVLLSPNLTEEQYRHYLLMMAEVVSGIEKNIFPRVENVFPDIESRRKLGWLIEDLRHSKIAGSLFTSEYSEPFAVGITYVIEGSVLGGRFILKNINEVLGFTGESGARYFHGYGNQTGAMWKEFTSRLSAYADENNADEIIAGANYAFDAIYNRFSKP